MKKVLIALAALTLFSCKESKKEEVVVNPTTSSEVPQTPEQNSIEQPPSTVETTTALSSKTLNGETISVTKARVTGKVLYVDVMVKSDGNSSLHVMNVKDINYVDDSEAKKHEILKDDAGIYQASPLQSSKGSKLQVSTTSSKPEVLISLKFAAPPESSKTITLTLPDFGTFDAIPISR